MLDTFVRIPSVDPSFPGLELLNRVAVLADLWNMGFGFDWVYRGRILGRL